MSRCFIKIISTGLTISIISCATLDLTSPYVMKDLMGSISAIVAGESEEAKTIAIRRIALQGSYEILHFVLRKAKISSAKQFVVSLQAYLEDHNATKAVAVFLKGLEDSGVEDARSIIELFHSAVIAIRINYPKIAAEVEKFIEDITSELSTHRGVAEMEAEGVPEEFSSPGKTWQTFILGLEQGTWQLVAKAMIGYVPESVDLTVVEERKEVKRLQEAVDNVKKQFPKIMYSIGKIEEIVEGVKALEIRVNAPRRKEHFWAVFERNKGAWKLVGVVKNISLLKP